MAHAVFGMPEVDADPPNIKAVSTISYVSNPNSTSPEEYTTKPCLKYVRLKD